MGGTFRMQCLPPAMRPNTHIPPAAPTDSPPLIRADREYQIAAALFYSQRLDEAFAQFERIARNPESPWRVSAPYLMGRTLLWKARLTQDESSFQPLLKQAEAQFLAVLANPKLTITHAGAERLLNRAMLITDPARALERLGRRLNLSTTASTRAADLHMYVDALSTTKQAQTLANDSLSRWIRVLQSNGKTAYRAALREWRRRRSEAWLYAALAKADGQEEGVLELCETAVRVPLDSPGGPGLHYQAARVLGAQGEFERAREELSRVIERLGDLPSARNQALSLNAQLSPDVQTFLRLAPRHVILASDEMDSDELRGVDHVNRDEARAVTPELERQVWREMQARAKHASELAKLDRLDLPTAEVFNRRIPLDVLNRAVTEPGLPRHLGDELRLVVWTRAVLLKRWDVARELAPSIAATYPVVKSEIDAFIASPDPSNEAAFVLLKLPGARPYMSWAYGRDVPVPKQDESGSR